MHTLGLSSYCDTVTGSIHHHNSLSESMNKSRLLDYSNVVRVTIYMVHLAVILIWQFGGFSSYRQIKITANSVVISQILINSNSERSLSAKLNIRQSVFLPKPPNLMSTKCTTHAVSPRVHNIRERRNS